MKSMYRFIPLIKGNLCHKWGTLLLAMLVLTLSAPQLAAQVTFNVNSTADNPNETPGDGDCTTGESVGTVNIGGFDIDILECTFRAAIQEANEANEPVIIEFDNRFIDVSPNGYSEIRLNSALPYISNRVTIAGETHPEFEEVGDHPLGGRPVVFINGSDVSASGIRFRSESTGSEVRHIAIGGFGASGILLQGNLGSGSGNNYTISNNLIGGVLTDSGAILRYDNGAHGIDLVGASETGGGITIIRENIIFNNEGDGVHLRTGTSGTVFQNNIIGLLPIGESDNLEFRPTDGNDGAGIRVAATAGADNLIGFFAGNTISNNGEGGILLGSDGQNVLGNHIGLPHQGNIASGYSLEDYGNGSSGIVVESSGNTIGGGGAATNVIGNSQSVGIRIGSGDGIEANDNEILRNFIGTDSDGQDMGQNQGIRIDNGDDNIISNVVVANNNTGIELRSGAGSGNQISRSRITDNGRGVWINGSGGVVGDTEELANGNIIGNNTNGIEVTGNAGQVGIVNNYIGTDETGANLRNDRGIVVAGKGVDVVIGTPGAGNIIGYNVRGIELADGASRTFILSNHIGIHPNGDAIGNANGIIADSDAVVGPSQIGYSLSTINPDRWNPGEDFGNIIAHNTGSGIRLSNAGTASAGNLIRGNSIYANGRNGIDLGMDNVDVGGSGNGPNTLLNFPEFDTDETFYNESTGQIEMRYRVRTNATNADYNLGIDVFLAEGDEQQGKTFLGTVVYEEDNAGNWVFGTLPLPISLEIESGAHIVATASDGSFNTSQFSEAVLVFSDEAEIAVSEQELDFGSLTEGQTETLSFSISSDGDAGLDGQVTLAEDAGGSFAITIGDGDFSLEPGQTIEVEVSFSPSAVDNFEGLIEITHNAENEASPAEVVLLGTGTAQPMPSIALSDTEVDFGELTEGETESQTITIQNNGEAEMTGEVTLAEDAGGVFVITSGNGSFSLDPDDDLEVVISFSPDDTGDFTGLLEIVHNADNNNNPVEVTLAGTGAEPTDVDLLSDVPAEFSLRQNYPNPFNPTTQIRFDLPESAQVRLDVFNSLGQRVATLVNETKSAGSHEISFDAGHLSSGHYLYRLEAGSEVLTRTMTLIK